MGAFTDGITHDDISAQERTPITDEPNKVPTDVEDVFADGEYSHGSEKFPVFNVSKDEFFQNMKEGRRRLRFKTDTPAQKYMQNTKYRRPFFIKHKDESGKEYVRKIK